VESAVTGFLEVIGLAALFATVGGLLLGTVLARRFPPCAACGQRSRRAARYNAAAATGAVTAFASGSYAGARAARDLHAVETGRVGNRIWNIAVGRKLVSKLYRR
jgi:hypothetical protein